jgi:hypothetical protein
MNLTTEDIQALADTLAPMLAQRMPPHPCPFDSEETAELRHIARRAVTIRAAVQSRIVDALTYGVITLVVLGIVHYLRQKMHGN